MGRVRCLAWGVGTLGLIAPLAGCGGGESETVPEPELPSIYAIYGEPKDTALVPYPSNRYAVTDEGTATGLRVDVGPHNTRDALALGLPGTIEELNRRDGFSTVGGVAVGFTGAIATEGVAIDEDADPPDPGSVRDAGEFAKAGSPFWLVDVDPESPEKGKAHGLVPRWWAQAKDDYYPEDEFTLVAEPAEPLRAKTRYAFVVTKDLKAADGGEVGATSEMEAVLSGEDGSEYAASVREALGVVEETSGVATGKVVVATVFTTGTVHDELVGAAKQARAVGAPKLLEPWTVETPLDGEGKVRFRAVFEAPEYRGADGKWQSAEGGAGAGAGPKEQKKVGLEVFLAFSKGTQSGPRPVVFYAHGLGGTKDGNWGTAGRLADLDAAVFAIDSPEHGSRAVDPDKPLIATFRFFGIDPETQEFDIEKARDNFRQMGADQVALVELVKSLGELDLLPVGAPDGVPDLDVSRFQYIGHSFGSVQGATVFALAPEIKQAVWNVGGAGLMMLLRDSQTFSLLVNSMKPAGTADGALARFFSATQAIVDPGDPVNFARYGTREALDGVEGWEARDVLIQEVVKDSIVPNSTSELLARAAGLENVDALVKVTGLGEAKGPVTGNLAGGATGCFSQFDVIEGGKTASHGELIFSPEAQGQYVGFFASGLADGHATCEGPY